MVAPLTTPGAPANTARNLRVLVIDDNPAIHEDFRKILAPPPSRLDEKLDRFESSFLGGARAVRQRTSFELDCASQGAEGLRMVVQARAEDRPYAVAFVDMRMAPGWDGLETARRLGDADPEIQIVLCTAYSDYSWEQIVDCLGESDRLLLLKKPVDHCELMQCAHALTAKWHLARQVHGQIKILEGRAEETASELRQVNAKLRAELFGRTLLEEELKATEERFLQAFRACPFPLMILTLPDQRFLDFNDALLTMIGCQRGDLVDQSLMQLMPAPGAEVWKRIFAEVEKTGRIRDYSIKWRNSKGETRDVLFFAERFQIFGQPHLLGVFQDVSERVRLEQQFRQAQKLEAVGQLAAGVAHDFNNILTVVQGHLGRQLARPNLDADQRGSIEQALSAADRGASLTRQLLVFSRREMLQPKPHDLCQIVVGIRQMLNSLLGEQVEQVYDCPAGMPSIYADRGSIEQVLINLAVNARDAMPHGGTLRIGISHVVWSKTDAEANPAREPGEYVCLTVTDNGTGMPREVAERIFEPFYTTKEVGKGTGVGLAIIHGVVRQHCGRIEVETKRGRGTTFRIYLPACDLPPCDNVKKSGKIEKEFAHGTERILVVEDEPALRELVEAILKEAGYHVLVAPDGPNALKIWAEKRDEIDLLITDMVLPSGMLGSAIAAKFREERPDLRLMFTSGYSPDHAGQIIDPAIPFLQKPYQPAELLRLAREALQGLSVKRSG